MMVAVFCLISFVLGAGAVLATLLLGERTAQRPSPMLGRQETESEGWSGRLKKQLDNLLAYDGSERGQQEIE